MHDVPISLEEVVAEWLRQYFVLVHVPGTIDLIFNFTIGMLWWCKMLIIFILVSIVVLRGDIRLNPVLSHVMLL